MEKYYLKLENLRDFQTNLVSEATFYTSFGGVVASTDNDQSDSDDSSKSHDISEYTDSSQTYDDSTAGDNSWSQD